MSPHKVAGWLGSGFLGAETPPLHGPLRRVRYGSSPFRATAIQTRLGAGIYQILPIHPQFSSIERKRRLSGYDYIKERDEKNRVFPSMFPSKVPRVFGLASVVLLFLVTYTTLHLYHRVPPSYPAADPQVIPIKDVATIEEQSNIDDAVAAETTTNNVIIPKPATPTLESTIQDEGPKITGSGAQPSQPPVEPPVEPGHLPPLPNPKHCSKDLEFLVRSSADLELTERVHYTRRYVQPIISDNVDRDSVANITEPLLKDVVEVDLYDCGDAWIPQSAPIKLHVPMPHSEAVFTHLIFGVATDYSRLNDSISPFAHWISGTGAKLVAVVTDAKEKSPSEMIQLQDRFEIAGINVTLAKPINETFTTAQNHFAVLMPMLEHSNPGTQWYGLLDDDTFFPTLKPLSDSLATLDHKVDAYVGALSEDFQAVRGFGFMAFGGAGAFLSAPLAKKLGDQALKCIDEATTREGDTILRDCIYTNSRAKLTILPGLYQQDTRGDVSGFFEGGPKPLNLHHWKSWYNAPVEKMAKATKFCGDCFLQRWRFGKDTVFSNGFSIAIYSDGVESVDLRLMEGTWGKAESKDFDFSLGPLRAPYPTEKKKSYRLREAEFEENGDLKQLYVRVGNSSIGELDQVVELVWQKH
ncbi:glycosyltransferase family 31 protein [Hypoxylon sp. FL1857]|nr:glycosyltransferase family 31 protein [Hypoxylon sp. FL1857]